MLTVNSDLEQSQAELFMSRYTGEHGDSFMSRHTGEHGDSFMYDSCMTIN